MRFVIVCFLPLLLVGCGGGSSSGSSGGSNGGDTSNQHSTLQGIVYDPAVENAVVKLCLIQDSTTCLDVTTLTNSSGGYSFTISDSINISDYAVYTMGGEDVATGESLSELTMSSPIDISTNTEENLILNITPFSTLVSIEMKKGTSYDAALQAISEKLGVTASAITDFSGWGAEEQAKAKLLTILALENYDLVGFESLQLKDDFSQTIEASSDKSVELKTLYSVMSSSDASDSAIVSYQAARALIDAGVLNGVAESNNVLVNNMNQLIENGLVALKFKGIDTPSFASWTSVMSQYASADVTSEEMELPELDLTDLQQNKTNFIEQDSPLGVALGEGSDALRDYYYGSTASHFYKAEFLLEGESDVDLNDAVYSELIQGYLKNDQPEMALKFIDRKVFKTENEAKNLIEVAKYRVENIASPNEYEVAFSQAILDKAYGYLKEMLASKGEQYITFDETALLADLLILYTELGLENRQEAVSEYLDSIEASIPADDATTWYALSEGYYTAADEYIDHSDFKTASQLLAEATRLAEKIPPLGEAPYQTYYLKVYVMSEIVSRYGGIGDDANAFALSEQAQDTRVNNDIDENDFTKTTTVTLLGDIFTPALIKGGYTEGQIEALAQTAVYYDGGDQYPGVWAHWFTAKALQATSEADINQIVESVKEKLGQNVWGQNTYNQVVTALTYDVLNKDDAYVAQSLINADENQHALLVLNAVRAILDENVGTGVESSDSAKKENYVTYGYAKLANLYASIGANGLADESLQKALDIARGVFAGERANNTNIIEPEQQSEALAYAVFHLGEMSRTEEVETVAAYAQDIHANLSAGERVSKDYTWLSRLNSLEKRELFPVLDNFTQDMFDVATSADALHEDGNGSEEDNKKRSSYLSNHAAEYFVVTGAIEQAEIAAEKALEYANQLAVPSDKAEGQKDVAKAYAAALNLDKALDVTDGIASYAKDAQLSALQEAGKAVAEYDAFPYSNVVTVDYDRDGLPDFYDASATTEKIAESNWVLDDDADGDGELNAYDLTPFFAHD